MNAYADPHLAGAYVDRSEGRFEVGCEGEMLATFPALEEAQRYASWRAGLSDCAHEIFEAAGHTLVEVVEPPFVA